MFFPHNMQPQQNLKRFLPLTFSLHIKNTLLIYARKSPSPLLCSLFFYEKIFLNYHVWQAFLNRALCYKECSAWEEVFPLDGFHSCAIWIFGSKEPKFLMTNESWIKLHRVLVIDLYFWKIWHLFSNPGKHTGGVTHLFGHHIERQSLYYYA